MEWVTIRPSLSYWPSGTTPPTFHIASDEGGTAVIELAWDAARMMAPSTYADHPLRYWSTGTAVSGNYSNASDASTAISVAVQTITITGGSATWTMPQAAWDAYVAEAARVTAGKTSNFIRRIYYRVRATPSGSSRAVAWPPDTAYRDSRNQPDDRAPHLVVLPPPTMSQVPAIPDTAAVAAMGGIGTLTIGGATIDMTNLWADMLRSMWTNLPADSSDRRSLTQTFGHSLFSTLTVDQRAGVLKLWLFAGNSRSKIPKLMDRQEKVGSNLTHPSLTRTALTGGKTLLQLLLDLAALQPHADLTGVFHAEHLVDDVISEILDPNGQVNQGGAQTCSPTSMQTMTLTVNSAEYVRIVTGLLGSSGSVTLANGTSISIPTGLYTAAPQLQSSGFFLRNWCEIAFQTAVLRFAMGSAWPTPSGTGAAAVAQSVQTALNNGLQWTETERGLEGLFNVAFNASYVQQSGEATWPTQAVIQTRQPALKTGFLNALDTAGQPIVLATYWGGAYSNGHAVVALRREGGRVFFKNPQYRGSQPAGTAGSTAANPPRRYEDPTAALESILETDLDTWIKGFWVPQTAIG